MDPILILNDRELAASKESLRVVEAALSPDKAFALTSSGLAVGLIGKHTEMLQRRKVALTTAIEAYESLRSKNRELLQRWAHEPGVALVLARVFRGLSQRQLADSLGMREQQIQRYEADRYRSISLANLKRICAALGVALSLGLAQDVDEDVFLPKEDKLDTRELRRVLSFVREEGWFPVSDTRLGDDDSLNSLINYASSARDRFGGVPLFRRGRNKGSDIGTLSLHAWRVRVTELAGQKITKDLPAFDPTNIGWLAVLVQLSTAPDGPTRAVQYLREFGIVLEIVPQIPGTSLDGAAFLLDGVPVIGMTLRYDRIDYFWFTLLHEVGHVFLHLDHGLLSGFFDDLDLKAEDAVEIEANDFASSCIVAPELWRLSPARLSRTAQPVENLARQLKIHPALIFGKIRNERGDYSIFSKEVGQGSVRRLFY